MTVLDKVQKPDITYVLLCVCTCLRPKMLYKCLSSINETKTEENLKVEVLVVDNDKLGSAKSIIDEILAKNFKFKLHYFIEEKRGLSNARNKVLEEAIKLGASHILFFDDDELIQKDCLTEHIKMYRNNPEAYISSGPTINNFMEKYPDYIKKHLVFKQKTTKKTGYQRKDCACGNVFFPVSIAKDYNLRFSQEYVFMGGEDADFFYRANTAGFKIVWNNEAVIEEMVTKERANINYILRKCYYNGYAGTLQRLKRFRNNKAVYLIKQIFVLFLNMLLLIPSLILGLSAFFNILGICYRTKGKIDAVIKGSPINFYGKIYGQ